MKTAQDVVSTDLEFIAQSLSGEFSRMAGKSLLVIGGGGFLGYYLVQSVVQWNQTRTDGEPIKLTVFDNFSRGMPEWLSDLADRSDLVLTRHDVLDPLPADLAPQDYVIHAASIASPIFYRLHPIETMDANVNGLRNLLEYARLLKQQGRPMSGFLYYSTSEIYGDPTPGNIPTPETYRGNVSSTGPRACYDESKRYGETLCVNFAKVHGVPVRIARPFNNFGPGLKITDGRVLPDFVRDVLAGRDIVMLSNGTPTRTFCYVADAVIGYFKILVRGRSGEAYNIGTESPEISVSTLADKVVALSRELFGYEGKVTYSVSDDAEYLVDNPNRRCPVIAKARDELGYEPTVTFDEGLRRALIWYSGNRTEDVEK